MAYNYYYAGLCFTLQMEGGFVDNPLDPGGATNRGVTQSVYNTWRKTQNLQPQSVALITDQEVYQLYYTNYWLAGKCDQIPGKIGIVHFDSSVNCGVFQATKFLQRAAGVTADGIIGPATLGTVNSANPDTLAIAYIAQRKSFYDLLVQQDPSQQVFLTGWDSRLVSLQNLINTIPDNA
jgi:lysozyme family protein